MPAAPSITVVKLDHLGQEVWRYQGRVLERSPRHVVLEAHFSRKELDLGFTVFRPGDRFVEHFYTDCGYNIFEIHAVEDDRLKGWYCNITRPAQLLGDVVQAEDLALDLWVDPDGRTLILDEDEFTALPISDAERDAARAALAELLRLVESGAPPLTRPSAR